MCHVHTVTAGASLFHPQGNPGLICTDKEEAFTTTYVCPSVSMWRVLIYCLACSKLNLSCQAVSEATPLTDNTVLEMYAQEHHTDTLQIPWLPVRTL